jgi:hypothetical protein
VFRTPKLVSLELAISIQSVLCNLDSSLIRTPIFLIGSGQYWVICNVMLEETGALEENVHLLTHTWDLNGDWHSIFPLHHSDSPLWSL